MLLQISGVSLEFLLRREMLPVRILLSALLSTLGPDPMFSRIVLYTFPPHFCFICASPRRNCRRGGGKSISSRGAGGTKQIRSSKCRVTDTHTKSQRL